MVQVVQPLRIDCRISAYIVEIKALSGCPRTTFHLTPFKICDIRRRLGQRNIGVGHVGVRIPAEQEINLHASHHLPWWEPSGE